jgi:putative transposase
MLIQRAYKTELDPNNKQKTLFGRCCGASRFVYNWGLAEWKRQYEAGEKPSRFKLCKQFNAQKDDLCPWIRELPYAIVESSFVNLGSAFQNFFRRVKAGEKEVGYPRFKKRGRQSSFQTRGYKTRHNAVWLGRLIGWVRLKERGYIPCSVAYRENGGATYVTISEKAGRWFISVQVEEEIPDPTNDNTLIVGVDFGINALAVCSDGTVFENPKPLRDALKKLARLQRELSRRTKGGSNWHKTKHKIQRCHAKIANIRKHTLHQVSHTLVVEKSPAVIVIENLNVAGMTKNHHLAQAISDCGFYELRRQVEYKAQWHGAQVIVVDRWYPSSKTCSQCGCIKDELALSDRVFRCEHCGAELDRDYNAALNLAAIGKGEIHPDCLGS